MSFIIHDKNHEFEMIYFSLIQFINIGKPGFAGLANLVVFSESGGSRIKMTWTVQKFNYIE